MGNYNNVPKRPPLQFHSKKHQFETAFVQRVKETPFSQSEIYSINPPIFMDPMDIPMGKLVQPRVDTNQFFPPQQIIKIAENLVCGLVQLQERGFQFHGDVSFLTVYYDKQSKTFKLSHPILSPETGYQLTKKGARFSLLSPQQLLALTDPEEQHENYASIKSDLFILGIILCQICTLLPSSEIYCPDTYIIFDKQIQNRLQLIKQYYNEQPQICKKILRVLNSLLQYDQNQRKSAKQVLWQIQQQQIIPQNQPIRNTAFPASPNEGLGMNKNFIPQMNR